MAENKLTDTACRKARPRESEWKLRDGGNLFLLILPSGTKSWRWKYHFHGKEKQLTIGRYPAVSLTQARRARDAARDLQAEGIDPSAEKKRVRAARATESLNTFESVARAWHAQWSADRAPRYARQVMDRLEADVFPKIGSLPIASITPPLALEVVRSVEKRGALEMAHRVRMHMSDVFVFGIASGLCEQDPAATVRKALKPTNPQLRPALLKLKDVRKVLTLTEELKDVWTSTRLASRLLALTAARPGIVRLAEKAEFEQLDGAEPLWRIPAAKMKLTRERKRDLAFEFVVPLSRQAVDVVRAAIAASPSPDCPWLFPGVGGWRKPISDSTLSKHYREAGFTGRHVPHGWRSSFSTIMNERAAVEDRERDRAIIDLMLAHVPEGVEAAYNRAAYMPRRRELAQAWADLIAADLPAAETLTP